MICTFDSVHHTDSVGERLPHFMEEMMFLSHFIGYLLIAFVYFYYNVPSVVWLFTYVAVVYFCYTLGLYTLVNTILLTAAFISLSTLFCFKPIRRKFITEKLLDFFKAKLPKISVTEAQAIEAGDVWLEGDIFSANINWKNIDKYKLTELTSEEQNFLDNEVEGLCKLLNDWDIVTKHKDLSKDAWDYIKNNKFFAINIEKKYGGLEFSATAQSYIVSKIATRSVTAAVTIMVPNALGPAELLTHYGTEDQKQKYLISLAKSEEVPCFALTSLYAGSDAGGMLDNGVICKQDYQGKKTLGISLTFSKRYITLAPVATLMGLAFKLYDPESLLGGKSDLGVTLALIPTNHPGIKIGLRHLAMYTPFQNGPISGENVFIPLEYIIGGVDYIGKGWYMLMECLSGGRGISLPALSVASTQIAYLSSLAYSNLRYQFKSPIANLEGIQEQLAKVSGLNFIANSLKLLTTSAIDSGLKPAVVSAIAKYHMTEMARTVINCAMDIHAGKGVMNGPNNYLINNYTASPVAITVEGANILTRNLIIFGQGAFRAHPYVLKELDALNDRNIKSSLVMFDTVLFKHLKFVLSNTSKLIFYSIKGSLNFLFKRFIRNKSLVDGYKNDLDKLATALAFTTDLTLLFIGGKLKVKEIMSARLGDVLSNIYIGISVVKYYSELANANKDNKEFVRLLDLHLNWSMAYLLHSTRDTLFEFIRNFPLSSLRGLMSVLIKPWIRNYHKPSDKLVVDLALSSKMPNRFFNSMIDSCYVANDCPLGKLNNIYNDFYIISMLLQKIEAHIKINDLKSSNSQREVYEQAFEKKIIDKHEYERLVQYAEDIDSILNVDAFDSLYFEELRKDVKKNIVSDYVN